ncbi:MAG: hypothetical protein ACRC4M_05765 [Mycoplasma sp.]
MKKYLKKVSVGILGVGILCSAFLPLIKNETNLIQNNSTKNKNTSKNKTSEVIWDATTEEGQREISQKESFQVINNLGIKKFVKVYNSLLNTFENQISNLKSNKNESLKNVNWIDDKNETIIEEPNNYKIQSDIWKFTEFKNEKRWAWNLIEDCLILGLTDRPTLIDSEGKVNISFMTNTIKIYNNLLIDYLIGEEREFLTNGFWKEDYETLLTEEQITVIENDEEIQNLELKKIELSLPNLIFGDIKIGNYFPWTNKTDNNGNFENGKFVDNLFSLEKPSNVKDGLFFTIDKMKEKQEEVDSQNGKMTLNFKIKNTQGIDIWENGNLLKKDNWENISYELEQNQQNFFLELNIEIESLNNEEDTNDWEENYKRISYTMYAFDFYNIKNNKNFDIINFLDNEEQKNDIKSKNIKTNNNSWNNRSTYQSINMENEMNVSELWNKISNEDNSLIEENNFINTINERKVNFGEYINKTTLPEEFLKNETQEVFLMNVEKNIAKDWTIEDMNLLELENVEKEILEKTKENDEVIQKFKFSVGKIVKEFNLIEDSENRTIEECFDIFVNRDYIDKTEEEIFDVFNKDNKENLLWLMSILGTPELKYDDPEYFVNGEELVNKENYYYNKYPLEYGIQIILPEHFPDEGEWEDVEIKTLRKTIFNEDEKTKQIFNFFDKKEKEDILKGFRLLTGINLDIYEDEEQYKIKEDILNNIQKNNGKLIENDILKTSLLGWYFDLPLTIPEEENEKYQIWKNKINNVNINDEFKVIQIITTFVNEFINDKKWITPFNSKGEEVFLPTKTYHKDFIKNVSSKNEININFKNIFYNDEEEEKQYIFSIEHLENNKNCYNVDLTNKWFNKATSNLTFGETILVKNKIFVPLFNKDKDNSGLYEEKWFVFENLKWDENIKYDLYEWILNENGVLENGLSSKMTTIIIIISVSSGGVLILLLAIWFILKSKRNQTKKIKNEDIIKVNEV